MERDETTLVDIARAARFVLEFKAGLDKAAFFDDFKTQSAVLFQLMIISEAVKRLSDKFRSDHPPFSMGIDRRDARLADPRLWHCRPGGGLAHRRD